MTAHTVQEKIDALFYCSRKLIVASIFLARDIDANSKDSMLLKLLVTAISGGISTGHITPEDAKKATDELERIILTAAEELRGAVLSFVDQVSGKSPPGVNAKYLNVREEYAAFVGSVPMTFKPIEKAIEGLLEIMEDEQS